MKYWLGFLCLFLYAAPIYAKTDLPAGYDQHKKDLLILNLTIDRPNETVNVKSMKKVHGFIPDYKNPNGVDYLPVTVKNKSYLIPIPTEQLFDEAKPDGTLTGGAKPMDVFDYTAIVPYEKGAKVDIEKPFRFKSRQTKKEAQSFNTPSLEDSVLGTTTEDFTFETVFDGNPQETDPSKTLDIVFISQYSSPEYIPTFQEETRLGSDFLFGLNQYPGKAPLSSKKSLLKIRRIITNKFSQNWSTWDINNFLISNSIPYDQISLVTTDTCTSNAYLGAGFMQLCNSGKYYDPSVYAHEFGHAFGGLLDEYVLEGRRSGEFAYHNRNCKEDPADPWINNIPASSFVGCNYENFFFSPSESSLMKNTSAYLDFNEPSVFLLNQAFSSYEYGKISVSTEFIDTHEFTRYLDKTATIMATATGLKNLGTTPITYSISLEPVVPWLQWSDQSRLTGTINAGPTNMATYIGFQLNLDQITTPGIHETKININITNGIDTPQQISKSILIFAGLSTDHGTVSISNPLTNTILDPVTLISISINHEAPLSGWKRIEYRYIKPDYYERGNFNVSTPFYARTISPYEASFSTQTENNSNVSKVPGSYHLFARGIPNVGTTVDSNLVRVQVKAPPNTSCTSTLYYSNPTCQSKNFTETCYLGAQDCTGNTPYCCPPYASGADYDRDYDVDFLDQESFLSIFDSVTQSGIGNLSGPYNIDIFDYNKFITLYGQSDS